MYKLVKENLFEFKKEMDPIDSLGLGRRKLIEDWLNSMKVRHYTINDDYTIDINGFVNLERKDLYEFPEFIQFGLVDGNFYCGYNKLKSLRGCPIIINGDFGCSQNNLESLEGSPKIVKGTYSCFNINITSKQIENVCKVKDRINTYDT